MTLAKIPPTICRLLAMALDGSPVYNWRFGGRPVRETLNAWCRYFQTLAVTDPMLADGHQIYHRGHPSSLDMALGLWEPKTMRLMRRLLRPGMTFVDVGAHIGWYTLLAARAVGTTGHVCAFEPDPSNFDLLRKNVAVNEYQRSVTLVPVAICDATRRVSLFARTSNSVCSTLYEGSAVGAERIEVEATSLDHFFGERNWPPVDLIKIDIEGAEGVALRGMGELSRRNPDLKLIIEYVPSNLRAAGVSPLGLFETLDELGFHRRSIISWHLIPVTGPDEIARRTSKQNWYGNLLCEKAGH
jgi:FkbM family methyltransferase